MWWSKKKSTPSRKEAVLTALVIQFLGEQDGPPERLLKTQLAEFFRSESGVERAYLARTDYGDAGGTHVALCIKTSSRDHRPLAQKSGDIFARVFGSHEHLDTIFVSLDQESDLRKVCRPFYV